MQYAEILDLRKQARITNCWLKRRLETILPEVMDREGFDMWIVTAREYNEGPVVMHLLPQPSMAARRRTILVFYRRPGATGLAEAVEKLTLSTYSPGGLYEAAWNKDEGGQWDSLRRVVEERDPRCIGINVSETFAFGDGLSHSEYLQLMKALDTKYAGRTRGAERLAVGYLERRLPEEIHAYSGIVAICHRMVAEGFSGKVVHPGVTTAADVA
ncbi:MAG TPA: Xaa-Pro aminopeptidase, partial [Firmicutes bacterium]|nr:Xaa-Pro aminopeptidase [Candidatus Fermentithermobacillaceae bacterium]